MLLYEDFAKRLAEGQLKLTSAVDEDTDRSVITPEQASTVLNLTNQGLLDLSTRLPIIKNRVRLTFQTGTNMYVLSDTNYGGSGYLSLLDDAFDETALVCIHEIHDQNGKRHSHDTDGHLQTPSYNSVRFTDAKITEIGSYVDITYQAKHLILIEDGGGEMYIPPSLELPLQLFVASLFFSHMNGEQSTKGDKYFASYLRHIGQDVQNNTSGVSEVKETATRFENNGFV